MVTVGADAAHDETATATAQKTPRILESFIRRAPVFVMYCSNSMRLYSGGDSYGNGFAASCKLILTPTDSAARASTGSLGWERSLALGSNHSSGVTPTRSELFPLPMMMSAWVTDTP
jgi:hypothetical protein